MKYSFYFRLMVVISLFFLGVAVEAYLENMPTLCAVLSIISFTFWFGAIKAPDHEKYNKD